MVTFAAARDEVQRRMEAVFAPEAFGELYPGVQAPKVYRGFPVNEPPFYCAVDEIVDSARTSGAASMGHAEYRFTVHVWLFAQHSSQVTAADALLAYTDAVFASVLADHTLKGAVDNALPSVETAGTAADGSKRYTAAAAVAIECAVFSQCPAKMKEIVNASSL